MKKILFILFSTFSLSLYSQTNDGATNIILIPHDYSDQQMQVMEEVIETMVAHAGFVDINRSMGVYTPMGPSEDYKEVIEIHFNSMDSMSDWRNKMEKEVPQERRTILGGATVLFYMYSPAE